MSDKSILRHQLRAVLAHLTETDKSAASISIREQLQNRAVFRQSATLAVFHPTATEPGILPLPAHPGKTFLFPLCHPDKSLTWHRPDHLHLWRPSPFGIIEPDPALDPAVPDPPFDLALVPGLAFTFCGDRLGHGAGFYDRFLASLSPAVPTIGLCFDCQILPSLPAESHDIRVSHVLHA